MRVHATSLLLGAALTVAVAPHVHAATKPPPAPVEWTSVARTDRQEAFVDPASRRERDGFVEAVVRYEYAEPQPYGKKSFLSARNVYRFDCANARIADRENRVYADHELQGKEVANASRGTKNPVWRNALPKTVDGVVLDYVCRKLAAGPAAPAIAGGGPTAAPASRPTAPADTRSKPPAAPKPGADDMPKF